MKKFKVKSAVAALILLPGIACAQDDWTGFYVGGFIGPTNSEVGDLESTSFSYGLQVGYNYQLYSNFVVGGELSYGLGSYSDTMAVGGESIDFDYDVDTLSVKLKAGYAAEPVLVYGIFGFVDAKADASATAPATSSISASGSGSGNVFGLGVATMATDEIILSAEALNNPFDDGDADMASIILSAAFKF